MAKSGCFNVGGATAKYPQTTDLRGLRDAFFDKDTRATLEKNTQDYAAIFIWKCLILNLRWLERWIEFVVESQAVTSCIKGCRVNCHVFAGLTLSRSYTHGAWRWAKRDTGGCFA